tara:strand:+ start:43486 stop:45225 length:1740 start_codon:yes stop_codon:yes gene_type:complete
MCGIIGCVSHRDVSNILLEGIKKLEYRGYDSCGISVVNDSKIITKKGAGRVDDVDKLLNFEEMKGHTGIAHTRWATMGRPIDKNAHPFYSEAQNFSIVHNGIIENYLELKEGLIQGGVEFSSDTDSEVIVHLIAEAFNGDLLEAMLKVIPKLRGAYALCVLHNQSKEIIGARNGSPLLVGIGVNENFLASDVSAFVSSTKKVIYLNDFEIAKISDKVEVFDFSGNLVEKKIEVVDWDITQAQKQGYKHFMIKEIMEQKKVVEEQLKVKFDFAVIPKQVHIVACGGAGFAGVLGEYLIEEISKIPCRFYHGSEFRYRNPLLREGDLVIAISQSGETADTLAAVRKAKEKGVKTLSIINVMGSTIARESDEVVYTRAGPEISVASTKAFLAQVISMYQVAFALKGEEFRLDDFQDIIDKLLSLNNKIRELAEKYYLAQNFIYIARNRNYAIALEGALKLKEIAYIHAEAYHAGELKHGPLALVCEEMPTFAICPRDEFYDKTFSNIEEVKARGGKVIVLATSGDEKIKHIADDVIYIPKVDCLFYPLLETIPVHLFAYHIANLKEIDVDFPRNLAKSCTVE